MGLHQHQRRISIRMEDECLLSKDEMEACGLEPDQVLVLKRCFDGFADEGGAIPADNVGSILSMMGMKVKPSAVREIIEEIDIDGSGLLEFGGLPYLRQGQGRLHLDRGS